MKSDMCGDCKALCCRYLCFEIDEPDDFEEFEDLRWYLCHEGISVHIDEDEDWYIQIDNPCRYLDDDNRCTIYEDRPIICRKYGGDECELTGDNYGYIEEFKSPEDIVSYAKKTLGAKKYEKALLKARAKADGVSRKKLKRELIERGILHTYGTKKKTSEPSEDTEKVRNE